MTPSINAENGDFAKCKCFATISNGINRNAREIIKIERIYMNSFQTLQSLMAYECTLLCRYDVTVQILIKLSKIPYRPLICLWHAHSSFLAIRYTQILHFFKFWLSKLISTLEHNIFQWLISLLPLSKIVPFNQTFFSLNKNSIFLLFG